MNWQEWVNSVLESGVQVAKAALGKNEEAAPASAASTPAPSPAPAQNWFQARAYWILGAFALAVLVLALIFRRE